VVREVELIPRRGWGGEGALGAVLGFGALHRLPVGLGEEVQAPGEKMFDAEARSSMEKSYTTDPARLMGSASPGGQTLHPAQPPPPFVSPNVDPRSSMLIPKAPLGATMTYGSTPSRSKKPRQRATASPDKAFNDMFEEGAKKSQEQDYVPSKKASAVPPPPKMSGPGVSPPTGPPQSSSPGSSPAPPRSPELGEPGHADPT
jgi:GRASP55/65 PDZ-like domain